MSDKLKEALQKARAANLKPPPKLTVSEWADTERRLSAEASAEPGQWRTSRAPYQKGVMDALNDKSIETIVVMSSAQVGKTEYLLNAIGYYVHHDPSPMLLLQPTLQMAETFSKDRLAPMIRDTPALTGKIKDPRARDSGNTLLKKNFPGGHITMAGANSPASLASRPVRIVLCDEVDRYPPSAGSEGDPVNLAKKRTTTFYNRKIMLTSTPTIKGVSRIEMAYEESDQRRYHVPCPECGTKQHLKWSGLQFDREDLDKEPVYVCEDCGAVIEESHKPKMLRDGEWIAGNESSRIAGFHLNELYSPWRRWREIVTDFMEAKHNPEALKTWVNTSLGETWEEAGEQGDPVGLMTYAENYDSTTPLEEILMVTAGADVQKDRVEMQTVGWGMNGIPYIIDHQVFYGNPMEQTVWMEVDQHLKRDHCGKKIAQAFIDSGYLTEYVYKFTKQRHGRRIFPCKGEAGIKEIVAKPRQAGAQRAMLVKVGIDGVKRSLMTMLKSPKEMIHFSNTLDEEFFRQLTAEKMIVKKIKGFDRIEFVKTRDRNEALDCFVYAYAAMIGLNPDWNALQNRAIEATKPAEDELETVNIPAHHRPKPAPTRRKGGFVKRF